jgi:hypothetical protein
VRKDLSVYNDERRRFRGNVARFGKKVNFKGYSEETILVRNVEDIMTGDRVTDHVWFTFTKGFENAEVREGDRIEFDARVKAYKKGYVNKSLKTAKQTVDFKLSHPTKITVVKNVV